MKREFKEGEIIFSFDYWNAGLNGFGKVIKDTIVESGDDIVLTEVKLSGENESDANKVFKIANNLLCRKCSCVVLHEHEEDVDYPYYCPSCDENLYSCEVDKVDDEVFTEYLHHSMARFSDDEYYD